MSQGKQPLLASFYKWLTWGTLMFAFFHTLHRKNSGIGLNHAKTLPHLTWQRSMILSSCKVCIARNLLVDCKIVKFRRMTSCAMEIYRIGNVNVHRHQEVNVHK